MNQVIEHIPEPDKCIKIIKEGYKRMEDNVLFSQIESPYGKDYRHKMVNWHIPIICIISIKKFSKYGRKMRFKGYNAKTILKCLDNFTDKTFLLQS